DAEHEEQPDHHPGGEERIASGAGCVWVLWRQRRGWSAESEPELWRIDRGSAAVPAGLCARLRLWHGARQHAEQYVAGLGRGCEPADSDPQPDRAGRPGALADGVPAVADAAAAALHADSHSGDQW